MNKEDFCDTSEYKPTVEAIKPLLAGKGPVVQSSVLADLLSIWLAGIRPDLREEFLQAHIKLVRDMIPASEREKFGPQGHPARQEIRPKRNPWAL